MRNLQTPATPRNARPHTRSWSRGKRFESARRLSQTGLHKPILAKEFTAVSTTQPRRWRRYGTINLAEDGKIRAVKTGVGCLYDPPNRVEMIKARLKASKGG